MTIYNTLEIQEEGPVATVWLNRPQVHNAFNNEMIQELLHFFSEIKYHEMIRVVVIRGKGASFCAGADLKWMKDTVQYEYEQNFLDSLTLAKCLYAIYSCPKVVMSVVHGSVMGGANGLIAASDLSIASFNTQFAFSEVSLGLVPSVISPYILRKVGQSKVREWMLLGNKFNADEAYSSGLVNRVVQDDTLENTLINLINCILLNSPQALSITKQLLEKNNEFQVPEDWMTQTAEVISKARISKEGQEGMMAFFEKRKPDWALIFEKK
jgi:methylglutaconyl-CoA hydratase